MLYKDLINNINKQLMHIAFYPEFEKRFSDAPGRSAKDKATRGGLTQSEYREYQNLNRLLKEYQDLPYDQKDRNRNVNSVAFHYLYDLEELLNNSKTSTLRDVVDSDFYTNYIPTLLRSDVQRAAQENATKYRKHQDTKEQSRLEKRQGYQITINDEKLKDQFNILKTFNPEWYDAVDEARRTKELVFIDTGEFTKVTSAKDIYDKLIAHGTREDNPIAIALKNKFEQESVSHLWMKAHNGQDWAFLQANKLTRAMVRWLNQVPDAAYHKKTFQISPISLAAIKHANDLSEWKNIQGIPSTKELIAKLNQWLAWVETENAHIRSLGIPKFFVRYVDVSDRYGTWYKNTYLKIKAAIEEKHFRNLSHLCKYIYNSVLASTGEAVLFTIDNTVYKYSDDNNDKKASINDRIINALVA